MNELTVQHTIDAATFASQTWLLDPQVRDLLYAQMMQHGHITLNQDATPVHYTDFSYAYYTPASQKGSVAVMTIKGVIYDYYASYICDKLSQIYADPNVVGLLVKDNSPGGSADAGYRMADMLMAAPFPTLAYIDYGQAASAGYMIAAACDAIYASRANDRVGSIGTYISYQSWSKAYEKMGVVSKDIYAEQSTEKNLEGREAEKGNFKPLIDYVSAEAQAFIDWVNSRRTINTKAGDPMKGGIFNATKGQEIGLIDGICDLQTAIKSLSSSATTSNATPRTTMLGLIKMDSLKAVKGLAADAVTEAHVTAINTELEANGYAGLAVVNATQLEAAVNATTELATAQSQLTTANANVTRLTNELTEANNKVSSLTTERDALKGQVTKETNTPGDEKTKGAQSEEKQADAGEADDSAKAIAELPHNKALEGTWLGDLGKK